MPFLAAYLIGGMGWRGAMLGLVSLAALVPLALAMRDAPRVAAPSAPLLPPSLVVVGLSAAVLLMHLVPLIQGYCISAPGAGGVLFVILIAAIAGRVAFGRLADVIGPIPAYMTASPWQTVGVLAFARIGICPSSTSSRRSTGLAMRG